MSHLPLKQSFKRTASFLTSIVLLGASASTTLAVPFPEYFPIDPDLYGTKTFRWTHGNSGSYVSFVSGTLTVPYASGPIECTGIANVADSGTLYVTNNGSEVQWLASGSRTDAAYLADDCDLSNPPVAFTFSEVTDEMLLPQGTWCDVSRDGMDCECSNDQVLLFRVQTANVLLGRFDAIIVWYLDTKFDFTTPNLFGNDAALGIDLPDSQQTNDHSVTAFDIYALGVGLIANGDINAETGELTELAELAEHVTGEEILSECGQLIQGVGCTLFQSDSGGLFQIAEIGEFDVGDRVSVAGRVDPECVTVCLQGDGCLDVLALLPCTGGSFLRGDCNEDSTVDISDGICILNWLFLGAPAPPCEEIANANGDAQVDISDPSYLFSFLFLGGPAPATPFPECGVSEVEPTACPGSTCL